MIKTRWTWAPIPKCPGRFVLKDKGDNVPPEEICGCDTRLSEFRVESARDKVTVAPLSEGGLISYRRKDGTWLHTLNTSAGFSRKLAQLGIKL